MQQIKATKIEKDNVRKMFDYFKRNWPALYQESEDYINNNDFMFFFDNLRYSLIQLGIDPDYSILNCFFKVICSIFDLQHIIDTFHGVVPAEMFSKIKFSDEGDKGHIAIMIPETVYYLNSNSFNCNDFIAIWIPKTLSVEALNLYHNFGDAWLCFEDNSEKTRSYLRKYDKNIYQTGISKQTFKQMYYEYLME